MLTLLYICGIYFPSNKEVHVCTFWLAKHILIINIRSMENDIVLWVGLALWDQYFEYKLSCNWLQDNVSSWKLKTILRFFWSRHIQFVLFWQSWKLKVVNGEG